MSKMQERIKYRKDLAQEAVAAALADVEAEVKRQQEKKTEEYEQFFGHAPTYPIAVTLTDDERRALMTRTVERVLNHWGVE